MVPINPQAAPFPLLRVIVAMSLMVLSLILFASESPPARFLGCVSTILFLRFLAAQSCAEARRSIRFSDLGEGSGRFLARSTGIIRCGTGGLMSEPKEADLTESRVSQRRGEPTMWRRAWGCILGCFLATASGGVLAQDDRAGRLELVESPARDELDGVVTSSITPDGKFLYASSWKAATLDAFARDPKTGRLELKQTINDSEILGGATGLALSPDGDLAVTGAFQSKAIVLYLRDRTKGLLSRLDMRVTAKTTCGWGSRSAWPSAGFAGYRRRR